MSAWVTNLSYDWIRDRLFVQDDDINRVLVFDFSEGISNYMEASAVIGQMDFSSDDYSCLPTQTNQCDALGLSDVFDAENNRWYLSDSSHARVLVFDFVSLSGIPQAQVKANVPYELQFSATNSQNDISYRIKKGALPPGLSLSSSGKLSGTPVTSGTYVFTVQVNDTHPLYGTFSDFKQYAMTVLPAETVATKTPTPTTVTTDQPIVLNSFPEFINRTGKQLLARKQSTFVYLSESNDNTAHKIIVADVQQNNVVFDIYGTAQTVVIKPGESKDVDVTNDGSPDITITVVSVQGGVAEVVYKKYVLSITDSRTPASQSDGAFASVPASSPVDTASTRNDWGSFLPIILLVIFSLGIVFVMYKRHKSFYMINHPYGHV